MKKELVKELKKILLREDVLVMIVSSVQNFGQIRILMKKQFKTLKKLDLDYLALYLKHCQGPHCAYKQALNTMEDLYKAVMIKTLGVINF